jgi:hypothetical protein
MFHELAFRRFMTQTDRWELQQEMNHSQKAMRDTGLWMAVPEGIIIWSALLQEVRPRVQLAEALATTT